MINYFFQRNPLFYSDTIDLTKSFLYLKKRMNSATADTMIVKYTNHVHVYCWNPYLARPFNRAYDNAIMTMKEYNILFIL